MKKNIIILILDIAVPNSHNITQTFNTKINKYLELSVAMRNLWCLEKNFDFTILQFQQRELVQSIRV
jgi:hypothetical protein